MSGTPAPPDPYSGTALDFNSILKDALTNYGGASAQGIASKPVPVDSSGMVDTWDLPAYMVGGNAPSLWFDTKTRPDTTEARFSENGGGAYKLDAPHSFNVNATPEEIMKQFAALSQTDPAKFQALQYELYQSGAMGEATRILGGWNTQTEAAIKTAMVQYLKVSEGAGVPVSFTQFLQNSAAANAANGNTKLPGQGSSTVIPPGPSVTDPAYLSQVLQTGAQAALDRNLSPAELDKFISTFQGNEVSQFASQKAGEQHTNLDPSAEAINFVVNNNRDEYNQHEVQGYADSFLRLMGISTAPGVAPDPVAGGM